MTKDALARIVEEWQAERPELDTAPMLVIGRIHRLAQLTDQGLRPLFAEAGLGNGEFDILAALLRTGPPHARTPRELQKAMLVTSGAISKQVDRLEAKGYVTRKLDSRDARSRMVTLTEAGAELVDELLPIHLDNERRLLSGLTATQRRQLGELLGTLSGHLEEGDR